MPRQSGCIYMLENKINGKKYIGQTVDLERRMREHRRRDKRQVIDKAITKYGIENFNLEILEEDIPVRNLDCYEKHYIAEYDTFHGEGYNMSGGGDAPRGEEHPMYGRTGEDNPKYGRKQSDELVDKRTEKLRDGRVAGSNHSRASTSVSEAKDILRDRIENELTQKQLSEKYNLGTSTIELIIKGEHWTAREGNLDELIKRAKPNIRVNLSEKAVQEIKNLYFDKGLSQTKIAEKYPVGNSTISRVVRGLHPMDSGN